jgi:hypothetical protein
MFGQASYVPGVVQSEFLALLVLIQKRYQPRQHEPGSAISMGVDAIQGVRLFLQEARLIRVRLVGQSATLL